MGFIQDKRFFTSAPKAAQEVIQPKAARFRGQHTVGRLMMILALSLMGGAIIMGAYDGIRKEFSFNKKSHLIQIALMLLGSLLLAGICALMGRAGA